MRPIALYSLLVLVTVAACNCDEDGDLFREDAGVPAMCPNGEPRPVGRCENDDECCDREKCNVATGICFAGDACDDLHPCPSEQICADQNGDGFFECIFERCVTVEDCTELVCPPDKVKACISGGCQCGEPCQGGCPAEQGCCVPEDRCYPLPAQCAGITCPPGQFIDLTMPGSWDTQDCMVLNQMCPCVVLPPLYAGDIGLYSAIDRDAFGPVMSAYNLTYGDLMFGAVSNDGTVTWEYVDGLAATASITGDINGPRGGDSEPGPDVGSYTDIAIDQNGVAHIAYQDRDKASLKYARGGRNLGWASHTIEGEGRGDTGMYSSIAVDNTGRPRIAYLSARENANDGHPQSVLRLVFSATTAPSAPANWQTRDIEVLDLSSFGCIDRCEAGEACRALDEACIQPDFTCGQTNCASDERCFQGSCVVIDPLPPFRDLPTARGLWPSLSITSNGSAIIAYHDRFEGNLKIATIEGPDLRNGAIEIHAIDGNGVNGSSDISGLFPSLFVSPAGEIHISYMNQTRSSLIYRSFDDNFNSTIVEVVEEGLGMGGGPDGILIGADSALVVDRTGVARIAYQDATNGELRYARRQGSTWNVLTLAGNETPYRGSFGFYNDQVLDESRENPVVSTYRYFLSAEGGADNGIEVFDGP